MSDMNANLHAAVYASMNIHSIITITFYLINKNLFTFGHLHVKLLKINWSKNNPETQTLAIVSDVIGDVHCKRILSSANFAAGFLPQQLLIIVYFGKCMECSLCGKGSKRKHHLFVTRGENRLPLFTGKQVVCTIL